MADTHSELQVKLAELDHELEEGDITQKGSVKRVQHFPTPISSAPSRRLSPVRHVQRSALTTRTATRSAEPSSCRSTWARSTRRSCSKTCAKAQHRASAPVRAPHRSPPCPVLALRDQPSTLAPASPRPTSNMRPLRRTRVGTPSTWPSHPARSAASRRSSWACALHHCNEHRPRAARCSYRAHRRPSTTTRERAP